jgi:hypothetical protein
MIYIFDITAVIEWIVAKLKGGGIDGKIKRKLRDNKRRLVAINEHRENIYELSEYYITEDESIASRLLNIQMILKGIDRKCPMLLTQVLTNKKLVHIDHARTDPDPDPQMMVYYPYIIVS